MSNHSSGHSGLREEEAKEFHALYVTSFIVFTLIAVVAHVLVWQWRPWFPGSEASTSLLSGVKAAVNTVVPYMMS
jgi:light-harvesting complex 1 beta chain